MPIMKWIAFILLASIMIYILVCAVRTKIKSDEEKEAHRRFGGTAPKK